MANANQIIVNGETILDLRSDTVTPETLQKGYTAHDKSGTKITGTLEASSSGAAKETWVLNELIDPLMGGGTSGAVTYSTDFTSNNNTFNSIKHTESTKAILYYNDVLVFGWSPIAGWTNQAYRKLTFDAPPTGELLTWLQANGVKQPNDTAVQDTKALTITSNGTVSVTPDAPYDALKKVDVTVDVASGGGGAGFKVTFPATAANWGQVNIEDVDIFLADGTTKSVIDYSTIGGKTIENVTGIRIFAGNPYYVLRMTLSAGEIAQFQMNIGASYIVTTAPNATATPYSAGRSLFWWPLSDVVISAIEMYNTD